MAEHGTPYFHNDVGVDKVRIGAKEFMCMGALPPFDHPHVFLDMGDEPEIVCPYCSTLYMHDPKLPRDGAEPAACMAGAHTPASPTGTLVPAREV